ncbi:unnamed protein product, partial [Ectocarpus sp. 12 AP-2014]
MPKKKRKRDDTQLHVGNIIQETSSNGATKIHTHQESRSPETGSTEENVRCPLGGNKNAIRNSMNRNEWPCVTESQQQTNTTLHWVLHVDTLDNLSGFELR